MIANMDFGVFKYVSGKENLSEIFDCKLDTYNHVFSSEVIGNTSLYDLLMQIKYNLTHDISVNDFLTPKYFGDKSNPAYQTIKNSKPTTCYNATFYGSKKLENLNAVTNLMFLDIDHFKSTAEALEYKETIIRKYDWIVSCNLSLSRVGLHVIVLVDKITGNEDFNIKYDIINLFYFDGILDKGAKSLSRHTIIPYDNQIFINENPKVLAIDSKIKKVKPLIQPVNLNLYHQPISTKEIKPKQKSTEGEVLKVNLISSPHTFFTNPNIEQFITDSAREDGLLFEEEFDENMFDDPNTPLQYPDGVHVMEVSFYAYRNKKVQIKNRYNTIGAISACLIYLNCNKLKASPDAKKKATIMKFMQGFNQRFCDPPITHEEVYNSVDGNWNHYVNGVLNVNRYFKKKYTLWSKHSTLTSNEKRSITSKIKSRPVVENSHRKISDAIEALQKAGIKITQANVAKDYHIGKTTVKKYWSEFKPMVKEYNLKLI